MEFEKMFEEARRSPEYNAEMKRIEALENEVPVYRITNRASGADLGEYRANGPEEALDIMAYAAGYLDYADLLERVPGSTREEMRVELA